MLKWIRVVHIVQMIVDSCIDFTSQCIIVRINHSSCIYHPFYSTKLSKIYRCWIVWGQNIRVVIIPSILAITHLGQSESIHYVHLINRFQFIASSYLVIVNCPWYSDHNVSCRIGRVHGREYPGDGHDRVQDPQGHGNYKTYFGRAKFGLNRGYQISAYLARNNRIRYGVIHYPTGSGRGGIHTCAGEQEASIKFYYSCLWLCYCYQPNVKCDHYKIYSFIFTSLTTFTSLGHRTNDNFGAGSNEIVLRWRRIIQGSCRKSSF